MRIGSPRCGTDAPSAAWRWLWRCSRRVPARADIIAAVQVTGPDGSPDIAVMNATHRRARDAARGHQHRRAGAAPEHQQGRQAARVPAARSCGGDAARDRAGHLDGQTADLFNGFEVATRPPSDPEIAPDGSVVYTGAPFAPAASGGFRAEVVFTQLANFPNGPFGRGTIQPQYNFADQGATSHPSAGGIFIAYGEERPGFAPVVILSPLGGNSSNPLQRTDHAYSHPAIAANSPQLALLVDRPLERRAGRHRVPPRDDRGPARHADRPAGDRQLRGRVAARVHARQPLRRVRAPPQDARPPVRVGQPDPDAAEHRRDRPRRAGVR